MGMRKLCLAAAAAAICLSTTGCKELLEAVTTGVVIELDPAGGDPVLHEGAPEQFESIVYTGSTDTTVVGCTADINSPCLRWNIAANKWTESAAPMPAVTADGTQFISLAGFLCVSGTKGFACLDIDADKWGAELPSTNGVAVRIVGTWKNRVIRTEGNGFIAHNAASGTLIQLPLPPDNCMTLTAIGAIGDTLHALGCGNAYSYSEDTDSWSATGTITGDGTMAQAFAVGTQLCGYSIQIGAVTCFDPATNTVTQTPTTSPANSASYVASAGGKLYVASNGNGNQALIGELDPTTNTWSERLSANGLIYGMATISDRVFAIALLDNEFK